MATTFPQSIQTFTQMMDVTASDGDIIAEYQEAIKNGDSITAAALLPQISNYQRKIITANYLNTITDTCYALQNYYLERYSPAYIVSAVQPARQAVGDFWIAVTG